MKTIAALGLLAALCASPMVIGCGTEEDDSTLDEKGGGGAVNPPQVKPPKPPKPPKATKVTLTATFYCGCQPLIATGTIQPSGASFSHHGSFFSSALEMSGTIDVIVPAGGTLTALQKQTACDQAALTGLD